MTCRVRSIFELCFAYLKWWYLENDINVSSILENIFIFLYNLLVSNIGMKCTFVIPVLNKSEVRVVWNWNPWMVFVTSMFM